MKNRSEYTRSEGWLKTKTLTHESEVLLLTEGAVIIWFTWTLARWKTSNVKIPPNRPRPCNLGRIWHLSLLSSRSGNAVSGREKIVMSSHGCLVSRTLYSGQCTHSIYIKALPQRISLLYWTKEIFGKFGILCTLHTENWTLTKGKLRVGFYITSRNCKWCLQLTVCLVILQFVSCAFLLVVTDFANLHQHLVWEGSYIVGLVYNDSWPGERGSSLPPRRAKVQFAILGQIQIQIYMQIQIQKIHSCTC